ncbi:MAG: FAD-binding protein [Chloroflexota bacterium]|nr:FAD-binding protein [Chloroflexota bacterium]
MKIVVCIKQVPFIDHLKFDPVARRVIRDGVENEINPFDKRAITKAIELRDQFSGEVVIVTMGPPQAKDALIEALAMGADRAVHLLGREFAGADTLATARTLALACKKIGYDLVFCGKYSTDAETAQVPAMLAEFLDLPQVTAITSLQVSEDGKRLTATRELDDGFETVEATIPAVLSAAERLCKPLRCTPDDIENAKQKPIEVWGAADLSTDRSVFGLAGSPTWVEEIDTIEPKRRHIIYDADGNADAVAQQVVQDLLAEGLFGEWKSKPHTAIKPRRSTKDAQRQIAIWVVAELIEGEIRPVTFELLGRSIQLAEKSNAQVAAVLIGDAVAKHAQPLAAYGADWVYLADAPALSAYSTEAYAAILADAIRERNPSAVLIPSTANGRDLAPRVAARLNVGLTGDCIGLEIDDQGQWVQLKPAFGGNIVAPIRTRTRPVMATVRPGMLQKAEPDFAREPVIERLPTEQLPAPRTRVLRTELNAVGGVALDDAEIVVGVGMGVGGAENLAAVQGLADALGASIGATRRVIDAGWLPRQLQIGLTGRSIAPRLYVAVGISGKFNHAVGMQRAGLVVAVNNNPNADIFKHADYGIVGDWAIVVPALVRAARQARK